MAKINHNNRLHTIDGSIENAKKNNAIHHYAEDDFLKGGHLKIYSANLLHFANTGYQVHWSVQNACNVLKNKGIPIQMIRHNA